MSERVILEPDETWKQPFSNGSEWRDWHWRNCERCVKASDNMEEPGDDKCDLQGLIWDQGLVYSKWHPDTWARVGTSERFDFMPAPVCQERELRPYCLGCAARLHIKEDTMPTEGMCDSCGANLVPFSLRGSVV